MCVRQHGGREGPLGCSAGVHSLAAGAGRAQPRAQAETSVCSRSMSTGGAMQKSETIRRRNLQHLIDIQQQLAMWESLRLQLLQINEEVQHCTTTNVCCVSAASACRQRRPRRRMRQQRPVPRAPGLPSRLTRLSAPTGELCRLGLCVRILFSLPCNTLQRVRLHIRQAFAISSDLQAPVPGAVLKEHAAADDAEDILPVPPC